MYISVSSYGDQSHDLPPHPYVPTPQAPATARPPARDHRSTDTSAPSSREWGDRHSSAHRSNLLGLLLHRADRAVRDPAATLAAALVLDVRNDSSLQLSPAQLRQHLCRPADTPPTVDTPPTRGQHCTPTVNISRGEEMGRLGGALQLAHPQHHQPQHHQRQRGSDPDARGGADHRGGRARACPTRRCDIGAPWASCWTVHVQY
jgi:hypothetical protein